jgi:TIR domain
MTASDPHTAPQWDAFISHAWEDKESFVRPLAHALTALGALVWYDEFSLKLGDSLSATIDKGLAGSRYGIVVLSKAFIRKPWPQRELEGLVAREMDGRSTILPVWHRLTREDVLEFSPPLVNKLASKTADTTADEIALEILSVIRPDIAGNTPYDELRKIATGEAITELEDEINRLRRDFKEFQCPYCGALLVESQEIPLDERQRDWSMLRSFECGFSSLDGYTRRPCPSDPKFPKIEDYNVQCKESPTEPHWKWICYALPKTDMARLLSLNGSGRTEQEAREALLRHYTDAAKRHW